MNLDGYIGTFEDIDILAHYGVKRRSGRYPWGSGDHPYQHSGDFLSRVEQYQKQGLKEKEIADLMDMSTTELRTATRLAKHERRTIMRQQAMTMREDGKTLQQIADTLGLPNESSVRSLLDASTAERKNKAEATADILREQLETKGLIDIGAGVERELGITPTTMQEALYILELEGYVRTGIGVRQVTNPTQQTTVDILCNPELIGVSGEKEVQRYAYNHLDEIKNVGDEYTSENGGESYRKRQYPASMDSSRIDIRYGDEGGLERDGTIEIRRGVADLSLGNSHYAQVRILVDGTHYMKGMAVYADDLPEGIDIRFNTNKMSNVPKMDVLKKIKTDDPDNPFGAYISAKGQSTFIDIDGKEKLSPINKLREEGEWEEMSRTLSSQFLSKQPLPLIKKQLNLTYADYEARLDEIRSLTNPTIKRELLKDFADECDGAVVHLKAAALPRQRTQVLLPIDTLKDNEIYAPNYKNGEQVALIRYPHGGTFEIPILTVNNKNKQGIDIITPNAKDAVGINSKVAERLSGADFDGDTATVIPVNNNVKIKSTSRLKDLIGFDPKTSYETIKKDDGYYNKNGEKVKIMTKADTQKQMGVVSNLITDMTLKGAPDEEITRAVRHSMVVIDAEKHKLDYKQSERDNGIAELKSKWQTSIDIDGNVKVGGASTLISKKKQDVRINETQGGGRIDPETGKVTYKESGRTYIDNSGKVVKATEKAKLMNVTEDLHTLSSGTVQEEAYADYGNKMKALANTARKESLSTGKIEVNPQAKIEYANEVNSLMSKLNTAAKNAPKEREAQRMANVKVNAIKQDNPDIEKKELKKISQAAIEEARNSVGASGKATRIKVTPDEWNAIQSGALSDTKVSEIFRYSDKDTIKELAMPKSVTQPSAAQQSKMNAMKASGYTNAEIAEQTGFSTSTVSKYLN